MKNVLIIILGFLLMLACTGIILLLFAEKQIKKEKLIFLSPKQLTDESFQVAIESEYDVLFAIQARKGLVVVTDETSLKRIRQVTLYAPRVPEGYHLPNPDKRSTVSLQNLHEKIPFLNELTR